MSEKHHNHQYASGLPLSVGDRYYAQDLGRDFWYKMARLGRIAKNIYGKLPVVMSGGIVSQGAGLSLNLTLGRGLVQYDVTIPDDFASQPPATITSTLEAIEVEWPDRTSILSGSPNVTTYSPVNDSATVNYVKIAYTEANGNTRTRVKKSGTYAYEVTPSYSISVDDTAPTDYEVCLATFISNGTTYTFSNYDEHQVFFQTLNSVQHRWGIPINAGTLSISGAQTNALTAFTETDVVHIDDGNDSLAVYRWNGSTFVSQGTPLTISGNNDPVIAALSNTDIAYIDEALESLRVYRWSGSAWSLQGTPLNISGIGTPALVALNSTDVVFIDTTLENLSLYRWNGSTWTLQGTPLNISGIGTPSLTALNNTDVVLFDTTTNNLTVYRWSGSTFVAQGTSLNISGTGIAGITALNSTDIVFLDGSVEDMIIYRWNGSIWSQQSSNFSVPGITGPKLVALNSTDVVFIDTTLETLTLYRYGYSISGIPFNRGDLL